MSANSERLLDCAIDIAKLYPYYIRCCAFVGTKPEYLEETDFVKKMLNEHSYDSGFYDYAKYTDDNSVDQVFVQQILESKYFDEYVLNEIEDKIHEAHEKKNRQLLEEYGEYFDGCHNDKCSGWKYGEKRCSCGNTRLDW